MPSGVYDRKTAKWIKRRKDGTYIGVFENKQRRKQALHFYVVRFWSLAKIAKHFNCANSSVQRLLESENVMRKRLRVFSKKELSLIERLYKIDKIPIIAIAKKLNTTFNIIKKCIKRLNLDVRSKSTVSTIIERKNKSLDNHVNAKCLTVHDYRHHVRMLAWRIWNRYQEVIDPEGEYLFNNKNHLDHKVSIYDGWKNNIPLWVISHPANIRVVSKSINLVKGKNSSIDISDLYKQILIFEQKYGVVFTHSPKIEGCDSEKTFKVKKGWKIKLNNRKC